MIWWSILFISLVVNGFCIWYIRELLTRFRYHSEISTNLLRIITDYHDHLENVYNMEAFYGDGTLEGLLRHTESMKNDIGEYKQIFKLFEESEPNEPQEEE